MSEASDDHVLDGLYRWTHRLPIDRPILAGIVAFQLVFLMLPTLIILIVSFQAGDIVRFPPDHLSLNWYYELPQRSEYVNALWRSVLVATFCTLLAIPIGVLTALGMIRYDIRFEKVFHVYFLLPFTVPLVVSGVILLIIFGELGIIGQLWTVGVALTIINLPFMIWSVTSRVNALDPELENAAKNLGGEEIQTFTNITLPIILPGVVTGALMMFVLGLNEFLVSLIITTRDIVTLPVLIYTSIRANISPLIAAVASVYVIVAFLAVIIADLLVGLEELLES